MGSIWLVRHAPTRDTGFCYGQSNVAVTLPADEAARLIYQRWQAHEPTSTPELWTSPWARTQPIAESLARSFGTACHIDPRLSELAFGEWEGRSYAELERNDALRFRHWLDNYEIAAPPGGESVATLRARVAEWLVERGPTIGTILAVTHAGVIRTARALLSGQSYSERAAEPVANLEPERLV